MTIVKAATAVAIVKAIAISTRTFLMVVSSRKSTYNYTTRSPRAVTGMIKNYGFSATSRQVYGPPRLPRDGLAKMTPDTANAL